MGPNTLGLLGHSWSLAIEEQFYFFWPLVCIALVARARNLTKAAYIVGGLALADAVYLMFAIAHWGSLRAYYGTDTHAVGLLAGSALALGILSRRSAASTEGPWQRHFGSFAVVSLVIFVCVCAVLSNSLTESALVLIAATLASVVLVAGIVLKPFAGIAALFSCSPATWVGKRSYGVYLYHLPIAMVFLERCRLSGAPRVAVLCGCLLLTMLVTGASYRWVEVPFLLRKEKFAAIPAQQLQATAEAPQAHTANSTASSLTVTSPLLARSSQSHLSARLHPSVATPARLNSLLRESPPLAEAAAELPPTALRLDFRRPSLAWHFLGSRRPTQSAESQEIPKRATAEVVPAD